MKRARGGDAVSKQCVELLKQLRVVRGHEVQRALRNLNQKRKLEGNGERGGKSHAMTLSCERLENRVSCLNNVELCQLTLELAGDVGVHLPQSLREKWNVDTGRTALDQVVEKTFEATGNDSSEKAAAEAFMREKIKKMKTHKLVAAALRKLEETLESKRVEDKKERNRRKQALKRQKIEQQNDQQGDYKPVRLNKACGIGACSARFATTEARAAHWRKRHNQVYQDRVKSQGLDPNDPHAHFELQERKGKNRMGQRERQRLALAQEKEFLRKHGKKLAKPEKQVGQEQKGDKVPADKEKLHPSWTAKKKQQEQASSISANAFKGSHITFDDGESSDEE